ncbi:G1 family glutamic endopeptidase [Sporolactobacillus pectinivorans]|uniref:G1 family glutamic endopeptidase n=1 Tax=Sporolactobacillus pectinivorans TaxID=1591408 RepID=UPI000C267C7D|nr:G1 family glutamic endopeptidase [Sporolactobacillus pectinivorans]
MRKIALAILSAVSIFIVAPSFQSDAQSIQPRPIYLSARKVALRGHETKVTAHVIANRKTTKTAKVTKISRAVSHVQAKTSQVTKSQSQTHNNQAVPPLQLPSGTQESSNWSGYAVTPASGSSAYTSITGSWIVPKASGSSASVSSQWIGLGGMGSSDLLQMGTVEQFQGNHEIATLFWEQLPAVSQNLVTVPVGSKIMTKIFDRNGSEWSLNFKVIEPNGHILTPSVSVNLDSGYASGIGTSAEWISEDPSDQNGNLYPLADTGVVAFTNAESNEAPINSSNNQVQPIALVNSIGSVLIAPSTIYSEGTAFSTTEIGYQSLYSRNGWHRYGFRSTGHDFRGGRHNFHTNGFRY